MIAPTLVAQYGLGVLAAASTGYFAAVMWRRRSEPTARHLVVLSVLLVVGAVGYLLALRGPVERSLAALIAYEEMAPTVAVLYLIVVVGGGLWFLFVLEYTGRGGRLVPLSAAGIGAFWLFLIAFALFADPTPPEAAEEAPTHVYAVAIGQFLAVILTTLGALLVLTTSLRRNALRLREALALSGGAGVFAVGPLLAGLTGRQSVVALVLLATSGLFALAVRRYPTFEAPPLVRIAGRDRLIEEMDDAVIVADRRGRVRDLNPAAEACFDADRGSALGTPVGDLFRSGIDPGSVAAVADPVSARARAGGAVEVTADHVTDVRGRSLGYLLVCRDVTERQRRERRLGVLTQLLAGAVGDRMTDIADEAAALADPDRDAPDPSEAGASIRAGTTDLVDLVARAREVERALADESGDRADVAATLRAVADDAPDVGPVTVEGDPAAAAVGEAVLEAILDLAVEDARERADGSVSLTVREGADGPEVHVVSDLASQDDGPDAGDRDAPADLATEMARLAARHVGGDVTVDSDAGRRRTVVRVPPEGGATPSGDADERREDRPVRETAVEGPTPGGRGDRP